METWPPLSKSFTDQQTQQCNFERPLTQLVELLIAKHLFTEFNNLSIDRLAHQTDLDKDHSYSKLLNTF